MNIMTLVMNNWRAHTVTLAKNSHMCVYPRLADKLVAKVLIRKGIFTEEMPMIWLKGLLQQVL